MSIGARIAVAVAVVVVDLALFALPLTGMLAAYVIIVRPPWFRAFIERLYHDAPAPPASPGASGREGGEVADG